MRKLLLAALLPIIGCTSQPRHDNLQLVGTYQYPNGYRYELYIREADPTLPELAHEKRDEVYSSDEVANSIKAVYDREKEQAEISRQVQMDIKAGRALKLPSPPSAPFQPHEEKK